MHTACRPCHAQRCIILLCRCLRLDKVLPGGCLLELQFSGCCALLARGATGRLIFVDRFCRLLRGQHPCWLRGAILMSGLALRYRDQKGRCLYCRRIMSFSQKCTHPEGRRITREHLIPRSKGGKGGANVVAACYRCNAARGDKPWLSFYCSPAVTHFRFEGRRETIEGPDIKTDEPIGAICE